MPRANKSFDFNTPHPHIFSPIWKEFFFGGGGGVEIAHPIFLLIFLYSTKLCKASHFLSFPLFPPYFLPNQTNHKGKPKRKRLIESKRRKENVFFPYVCLDVAGQENVCGMVFS